MLLGHMHSIPGIVIAVIRAAVLLHVQVPQQWPLGEVIDVGRIKAMDQPCLLLLQVPAQHLREAAGKQLDQSLRRDEAVLKRVHGQQKLKAQECRHVTCGWVLKT